jgi:hypothetical protein
MMNIVSMVSNGGEEEATPDTKYIALQINRTMK